MYSTKISNSMTIKKENGEVKLNELNVNVDGYSEPKLLEKAKENYNSDKDLAKPPNYYPNEWPKGTWHEVYWSMWRNLLKWKKKRVYKKE